MIGRKTRIVCTIGKILKDGRISEEKLSNTIKEFINAGMDVARINMAHFNLGKKPEDEKSEDEQYLEKLIDAIRTVSKQFQKNDPQKETVAIMGDIQGPKVRIDEFLGKHAGKEEVELKRGDKFTLTTQEKPSNNVAGALVKHEGEFKFIENVKDNANSDVRNNQKLIEFWFGDGAVILEAKLDDITDTDIVCTVRVGGTLKKGKGISLKNTAIDPEKYELWKYEKDQRGIEFLLKHDVDLLALSFVNTYEDVEKLHSFIDEKLAKLGEKPVKEKFYGMKEFPIISKIETQKGIDNIEEILKVSYGIMVARGDMALHAGIVDVPIHQKDIIERCTVAGKPVITATQMLLSMMEFEEPKRSEATDVANAIFDGTDALMLSEETADSDSREPAHVIDMMGKIAERTERKIRERNESSELEYDHRLDRLYQKIKSAIKQDTGGFGTELKKRETTALVSHTACKMAYELKCRAIVVLTDTGGTARMISRFSPDVHLIAGVYDPQIARILKLSHGIHTIVVNDPRKKDDSQKEGKYPFETLKEVIRKAKTQGLTRKDDLVITVAGYPLGELGTITFVNVFTV